MIDAFSSHYFVLTYLETVYFNYAFRSSFTMFFIYVFFIKYKIENELPFYTETTGM